MRGLYLYCLREQTPTAERVEVLGVDGKNTVRLVPFREMEAVVSEVSMDEFASEEVQRKAREDINWIKEKALAHQHVVAAACQWDAGAVPVIPMSFGIVYRSEEGLQQMLEERYPSMRNLLSELRGKQEWSVKVYLQDKGFLDRTVSDANPVVKQKQQEMADMPEGMAFFMEEELKEVVASERKNEIARICQRVYETLAALAVSGVKTKVLEQALTGRVEPMVFNAAFLIETARTPSFRDATDMLRKELQTKGLSLEWSGPLAPYNFSSLEKQ